MRISLPKPLLWLPPHLRVQQARNLERLTAIHAVVFVIAATWGFGGNIYWMRTPLALWGTLGAVLTLTGILLRLRERPASWWPLVWLLPWVGLSAIVLLSLVNPNYHSTRFFDAVVYRPVPPRFTWLPSSARPDLALREWWLFSGLYLAGFNLALNVRRRRVLRHILAALVVNASVLAVFGTVQKLSGAPGLFFGLQPSPNEAFFASFIYHNHWGSFALLMIAAALALAFHVATRAPVHGFLYSPAPVLLCSAFLLAAAIPLSTSRSTTLLLVVFAAIAAGCAVAEVRRFAARRDIRATRALVFLGVATTFCVGAIGWLAAPIIQARLEKTNEQLAHRSTVGGLGGREIVYRNTWLMAQDRPWTGWGLESYRTVFVRYNTEGSPEDHLVFHYDQAHSDWLQSLAEVGWIGTTFLVLMGGLPLWTQRRILRSGRFVTAMLLAGCGLIALYAWVEFPFANPAVALCFWTLFFTGIRYASLSDTAK